MDRASRHVALFAYDLDGCLQRTRASKSTIFIAHCPRIRDTYFTTSSLDALKPSMPSFSALCCRRSFAYAATRIQNSPSSRIGLVPLATPICVRAFGSCAQRLKESAGTSPRFASGFSALDMSGKQATLGYVRDSQLTIGCVAGLHWINP